MQDLPRSTTQFVHGELCELLCCVGRSHTGEVCDPGFIIMGALICSVSAGVASGFLKVGSALAAQRGQPIAAAAGAGGDQQAVGNGDPAPPGSSEGMFDKGAYFIGKAVWGKGYGTLLQRMREAKDAGSSFQLDCFGSGEDDAEVPCELYAGFIAVPTDAT